MQGVEKEAGYNEDILHDQFGGTLVLCGWPAKAAVTDLPRECVEAVQHYEQRNHRLAVLLRGNRFPIPDDKDDNTW